ncbi:GPCR fungal pheromone mating factor [Mycena haematopus]|nr:GPCR fungal pheromone mating factor [Mycena haematopus]
MSLAMPICAFLGCALVLVPLPWHWRSRNTATLSMMAWLFMSNLTYAINAIIWSGHVNDVAPVWCDIMTKLRIGSTAAGPSTCFSLILQLRRVANSLPNNRQSFMLDLFLCWGYPALTMALHYIVQGHRFNILEDIGCLHTTYVSIPAILILYGPITMVVILNFVFGGLAFSTLWRHRHGFAAGLERQKSSFSMRRYVRAMIATILIAVWDAGVIFVVDFVSFEEGISPYTSWADVHYDFARVVQIPMVILPPRKVVLFRVMWWTVPISAYGFFCCFALGEEGAAEYAAWGRWVLRLFGRRPSSVSHLVELQPSSPPRTVIDEVIHIKCDIEQASFDSVDDL